MPSFSSVTFMVTVQLPASADFSRNSALGAADRANPIAFGVAYASTSIDPDGGPVLVVSKSVLPFTPVPGSTVTYTVSVRNASAGVATNAVFNDAMPAGFAAANPAGYGNVTCRALTAGDNVLATMPAPSAVACPTFTSGPGGLSASIAAMPENSGLRITYTAIVPPDHQTVANIATLRATASQSSSGDTTSQANVAIQAAAQLPPDPVAIPTLSQWALILLSTAMAWLGRRRLLSLRVR